MTFVDKVRLLIFAHQNRVLSMFFEFLGIVEGTSKFFRERSNLVSAVCFSLNYRMNYTKSFPYGGKEFGTVFGFFWIPKRKFQKNEARQLAVGRNFESNFHDFVSFSTLFWP